MGNSNFRMCQFPLFLSFSWLRLLPIAFFQQLREPLTLAYNDYIHIHIKLGTEYLGSTLAVMIDFFNMPGMTCVERPPIVTREIKQC